MKTAEEILQKHVDALAKKKPSLYRNFKDSVKTAKEGVECAIAAMHEFARQQQPQQGDNGWISVKERLPEPRKLVWVSYISNGRPVVDASFIINQKYTFTFDIDLPAEKGITHWKPKEEIPAPPNTVLPASPSEGEEEVLP